MSELIQTNLSAQFQALSGGSHEREQGSNSFVDLVLDQLDGQAGTSRETPRSNQSDLSQRPDKVGHIINSWKLRFNGNPEGISVNNFIYREEALTGQTLEGNFSVLSSNASLLFEGKVRDFYWRCHKQTQNLSWDALCAALRRQFRDARTDLDIREAVRDRKQQDKEGFDAFYNAIEELVDSLEMPLTEMEMVEGKDKRPYAKVRILDRIVTGLLDTGAAVSVIGGSLAQQIIRNRVPFKRGIFSISTADGKKQEVLGRITTPVQYKDQEKKPGAPQMQISELVAASHDLTATQHESLQRVIGKFPSFAESGLGKTSILSHTIDVGEAKPVKQRHFPVSPAIEKLLYAEVDRMLKLGVIEESDSAWSTPVILVQKPGKVRLCLDSRKVNAVTKKDAYPLPQIDGILGRLPKAVYISSLDLKDAYWQVPLDPESRDKTSFTIPGNPLYQYKVMPFGLSNASQTMTRLMDKVVPAELRNEVFVYLDDLLIVSDCFEAHLKVLEVVAGHIKAAGLTLNIEKNHASLKWLMSQPDLHSRLARWALKLQRFNFKIEHRSGKLNVVPDALSRVNESVEVLEVSRDSLVELDSGAFKAAEYVNLVERLKANGDRLPDMKIVDGLAYKRTEHATGEFLNDQIIWKIWIPKDLIQEVLKNAHDHPMASHGGIHKTERVRRYRYWPGLVKDVKSYVLACDTCKMSKAPNTVQRPPIGVPPESDRFFQRLFIDFLGPYPRSRSGNIGIFIVLDHYSKFVFLKAVKKLSAEVVVKYLQQELSHTYGVPETIISDNGS
nr:uncharacterized protein K02A2.6-like [Drosophila kikkawai]